MSKSERRRPGAAAISPSRFPYSPARRSAVAGSEEASVQGARVQRSPVGGELEYGMPHHAREAPGQSPVPAAHEGILQGEIDVAAEPREGIVGRAHSRDGGPRHAPIGGTVEPGVLFRDEGRVVPGQVPHGFSGGTGYRSRKDPGRSAVHGPEDAVGSPRVQVTARFGQAFRDTVPSRGNERAGPGDSPIGGAVEGVIAESHQVGAEGQDSAGGVEVPGGRAGGRRQPGPGRPGIARPHEASGSGRARSDREGLGSEYRQAGYRTRGERVVRPGRSLIHRALETIGRAGEDIPALHVEIRDRARPRTRYPPIRIGGRREEQDAERLVSHITPGLEPYHWTPVRAGLSQAKYRMEDGPGGLVRPEGLGLSGKMALLSGHRMAMPSSSWSCAG